MNAACFLLLTSLLSGLADPEQAGRKALDRGWGGYPWYDSASDGIRRVEVSPPPAPSPRVEPVAFDGLLMWLAWIGIALLLCLVLYLLYRAYRRGSAGKAAGGDAGSTGADDAARIRSLPFPVEGGRFDLLGEARRFYQQLDFRRAIVYLFSFELVQLDKHQIVRLGKGKTNRQYLREIGRRSALRRLVEQTMVAFEDVFFGNRNLDRGRFESCWSRLEEFESLTGAEP